MDFDTRRHYNNYNTHGNTENVLKKTMSIVLRFSIHRDSIETGYCYTRTSCNARTYLVTSECISNYTARYLRNSNPVYRYYIDSTYRKLKMRRAQNTFVQNNYSVTSM